MPSTTTLVINFLLFSAGVSICLLFNDASALLAIAVALAIHLRLLRPQEWRLLIQLPVLGWIADAVFLRMDIISGAGDIPSLARIGCWLLLASTLCHSLYPLMRRLPSAAALGAVWGLLIYALPVWLSSSPYSGSLSWPLLLLSAALTGMLLLVLFSFIIRTRILPDIEKSR